MSVFALISANMEVMLRRVSTLGDDRLDGFKTVSAATCLDKGLGLGGNSLSVGTFVEG